MPARSNDFQAVVYFVERHLAADATVTESASLTDRVTGQDREVDVLITCHVAGHPIRIGIECRDRTRRDDVGWVEQMRAKHDDLPTDRLVLVSASGSPQQPPPRPAITTSRSSPRPSPSPMTAPSPNCDHIALSSAISPTATSPRCAV